MKMYRFMQAQAPTPPRQILAAVLLLAAILILPQAVAAANWQTYRGSIARSGVAPAGPGTELSLQWTYVPIHRPQPAWPTPGEEMPRMHSDNAFHVAIADGRVFFGSSVTDEVRAIDVRSGLVVWTFPVEGPVRFAPTVVDGRVYFGSDDGHVYCLAANNGTLIWKYRPGPSDEKVLGNGRMISLWPVRTSVLVDGGVVYCGAGVFPYEGLYLCALDADDGSVVWKNDTIGDRAHELSYGGISPQGYLLASDDVLYVPAGRAMPAAFSRETGEFLFYASPGGKRGGTWALLDDNQLIAGVDLSGAPHKVAYDANSGRRRGDVFAWFPGIDMAIEGDMAYVLAANGLYAIHRKTHAEAVQEVDASVQTRRQIAEELKQLCAKQKKAEATESRAIEAKIDELTGRTAQCLAAENRLKNSCFVWHLPAQDFGALILADDTVFLGGSGRVMAVDAATGKSAWTATVEGTAVGLAATGRCLVVSTDDGEISCFAATPRQAEPQKITASCDPDLFARLPQAALYRDAARQIVAQTNATKGYCLVLDCHTGQLAYELSRTTDLRIVCLASDSDRLQPVRERLRRARLLGSRVVIEPWKVDSLPPYFANLVVSEKQLTGGAALKPTASLRRILRPGGGTIASAVGNAQGDSQWQTYRAPELAGAGSWTHQYGNPQNTACSQDERTAGSLGVLWFGEPGPVSMVERHAKAQSPLSIDGRLFIQGEELIMAVDAYNGTLLWERQIPGAVRARVDVDGGNLALDEEALYVTAYDACLRLDPATGATARVYGLPQAGGASYRWGSVAIAEDILFGVRAEPFKQPYAATLKARYADPDESVLHAYKRSNAKWFPMTNYPLWENYNAEKGSVTDNMMAGDMVFALDPDTGKTLWTQPGDQIANLTVSIGGGSVFFADCGVSAELRAQALAERRTLIEKGLYEETDSMKAADKYEPTDVRLAVAVDARTGAKLWEKPIDFTGCCGDAMGSAYQDGVLLFFGCVGNHDAFRFREDQLTYRRIVALSARTGEILWSRPLNYRTRPVVIGERIIIEPRACDLHTGEIQMRVDPVTGKKVPWEFLRPGHTCAVTSASANALFYRSYATAFYDLTRDAGVALFGGIRPGCWINMIPAGGLVLVPEASVGCTCSFPLRCSYALVNKPDRPQPWTVFINHTELNEKGQAVPQTYGKPVQHLAINFGAPADMKDDAGTLWLAYPNPRTVYGGNHFGSYGVRFDLHETILDGMGYFCQDFRGITIEGTDRPWLFTSGCLGLSRCEIPLRDEQARPKQGVYTVRLGFRVRAGDRPGRRTFDIKLQGRTVAAGFDLAPAASGTDRAVIREFPGITVEDNLILELVPKSSAPGVEQAPRISFVEIVLEEGTRVAKDNR